MKYSLTIILWPVNLPGFGGVNLHEIVPINFFGVLDRKYSPLVRMRQVTAPLQYDDMTGFSQGLHVQKRSTNITHFWVKQLYAKCGWWGGPQFWGDPICTIPFIKDKHIYIVKNSDMANRHIRKMNNAGEKFIIVFKGIPNLGLPFRGGCSTLSIRYMRSGENSVQWI